MNVAHGRIERREQEIFGKHLFAGQTVEKGGLPSVGIADQRNHRPWRALPAVTMKRARALHLVELAFDLGHAIADQAAVGLDLGFARTAEEAETATLPLEVGPAPHQPARLIIEMGEF